MRTSTLTTVCIMGIVGLVDFRKTVDATDLADGLHPNDKGYEKMAQAWADAMTPVVGAK